MCQNLGEMRFQLLAMILAPAFVLAAQSPERTSCMAVARTTTEMHKCVDEEAIRADAELNRVYQELLSRAAKNAEAVRKIRAARRAWIGFRDAHVASVFPSDDKQGQYGSIYPVCVVEILADLTRQRTAMLRAMLSDKGCGEAY